MGTGTSDRLFDSARRNDVAQLASMLDEHPDNLNAREPPYGWTLLHAAAHHGSLDAVRLLIDRGLDVNVREHGDSTYAMHWAAAAGHVDTVRTLADAGGDVIGAGDDHELEVIGWATCWDGCDDDPHHDIVDLLISRGARHHIFSAIAMNLADEVRRIVAADPSSLNKRMSRNENNQSPLQFAVRMNRPQMVALLIELGADPLAVDGGGQPVASYAKTTDVDRPVMQAIHRMMLAEVTSADRGDRASRASSIDLLAAISLEDWQTAARLISDNPDLLQGGGALHLLAKRGDARGGAGSSIMEPIPMRSGLTGTLRLRPSTWLHSAGIPGSRSSFWMPAPTRRFVTAGTTATHLDGLSSSARSRYAVSSQRLDL